MKRFILFPVFICFCLADLHSQAQHFTAEESRRLAALPSDERRCDTLNEWAYQLDGEASLPYARAALKLSERIGYMAGSADALVRFGQAEAFEGDPVSAEAYYRRSLTLRKQLSDMPGQASCYNQIGLSQKKRGEFKAALESFREGVALFDRQPPHITAAKLYNNMAATYSTLGMYNNAIEAFEKSLKEYARLQKVPGQNLAELGVGMASLRMNMAVLQQENLSRYDMARDSLLKCLSDFEKYQRPNYTAKCLMLLGNNAYYSGLPEAAIAYYDRALVLKNELSVNDQAIVRKNRGRVYLDRREFDKAMLDFQSARDTFSRTGNLEELASVHYEIGSLHYENDNPAMAVDAYREALNREPKNPVLKSNLLYYLPNALDELGRHEEASGYSKQYIDYLGGLDSKDTRIAMQEAQQVQVQKNRAESKIAQQERQTERLWLASGAGATGTLILLLTLLTFFFRSKKREAEKNMQLAVSKQETKTYSAYLEGQEATQQKIGKELHDGLGSLLSTVKLHFASVEKRIDHLQEESRNQYETANRLLDHACQEVRRISHEMASALLVKFGLKAQLEALADAIRSSGKLKVELVTFGLDERLHNKLEINVYRMIQVLTHNVIEHAQAQKITINVNRFNDLLNIIVEDDGIGFVPEDVRRKNGIGMKNLETRVRELEGELHIDTAPGRGARISIDLPTKDIHDHSFALNN